MNMSIRSVRLVLKDIDPMPARRLAPSWCLICKKKGAELDWSSWPARSWRGERGASSDGRCGPPNDPSSPTIVSAVGSSGLYKASSDELLYHSLWLIRRIIGRHIKVITVTTIANPIWLQLRHMGREDDESLPDGMTAREISHAKRDVRLALRDLEWPDVFRQKLAKFAGHLLVMPNKHQIANLVVRRWRLLLIIVIILL